MDITTANINSRTTSGVRAKVQRAPRREGAPTYPGAAWRTIPGMMELFVDSAYELAAQLQESDPTKLYKVVTYNIS